MDRSPMVEPQNRKRQPADEASQANINPPTKKTKTRSEIELDAWLSWEYPPEFYDRLSKIELTRRALKVLGRRTRTERSHSPACPITQASRELPRFARHGGPDLRDLRGYPLASIENQHPDMSPSRSSRSQRTKSTYPFSSLPTSTTTRSKAKAKAKAKTKAKDKGKTSPYDRNFDLHLTENAIRPLWRSREPDLEGIRATLVVPRPSLSPSIFSDDAFKTFRERIYQAKDEDDVMANVIPIILGPGQANRFCARNTVFTNLEPLTDNTITAPKPDLYYGAYPDQLAQSARNELTDQIVPSTMLDKPMAPNFFLELKGPDGTLVVATRQARYHGAIGSRGIHSLQNYGAEEPEYDGNAYTFSATYYEGTLKLYAHHITAPTTEGGRPEYHMTEIKSYAMSSDLDTFVKGATALRNIIDFAERQRDRFIRAANVRASQLETNSDRERTTAAIQPSEDSPEEPAFSPHYLDMGDDSQDPPATDPSQGLPKPRRSPRNHPIE